MVDVVIDSVRVSLTNQQRIVLLKEVGAERYLPIWIGPYEAESITIALQEIEVARPQTHDLMKNMLNTLGARLLRVEVVSLRDDVFYGNLVMEAEGRVYEVDARPSDALALAVRTHVPIRVAREVMDAGGITPSQESQAPEEPTPPETAPEETLEKSSPEERLSVFEDFLQNLDIDLDSDQSKDKDEPDDEPDDKPDDPEPNI